MDVDYIRCLYNYHYAAHHRLWECIMHLTDEQFVQDVDYSIGSVRNHMVHLIGVDSRWLARMQGMPLPERLNEADFTTRQLTRQKWNEVEVMVRRFVADIQNDQLNRVINYDMPHRGGAKSNFLWQILLHVVNHGTDHRAQILPILHRLGAPTFEQDLMIYLWDQKGEAHGLV